MSLDLDLLPLDALNVISLEMAGMKTWGFSHTVLRIPNGRMYHDLLAPLATKLPDGHSIFSYTARNEKGEVAYGTLTTDVNDEPYTWVKAGELALLLQEHHPTHPTTKYIEALPAMTYVILGWR